MVKGADPDVVIVDQQQPTTEVLSEEQARIIVGVFGKFSSVVFDCESIVDMF